MKHFYRLSPTLVLLSTRDIFAARFFLLISTTYLLMAAPILVALIAAGRSGSIPLFSTLTMLHFCAMILIGNICNQIDVDIHSGNASSFRTLWLNLFTKKPTGSILQSRKGWFVLSLFASLFIPVTFFISQERFLPLLLLLISPLWPFLSLLGITRKRLVADYGSDESASLENHHSRETILNSDRTRPMSSFTPGGSGDTVIASAQTNPSDFIWTEDNRQALMMDILSGYISFEDARNRYGLKNEDLKAWMKEYMQQNQSPQEQNQEQLKDPDKYG